uniref:Uncharacterized protein n=1 Tax=Cairina moschata TaxID=8855 RepID=A0A8C3BQH9_CAIMO
MQPTLSAVRACSPQCTPRSSSSTCAATCPARATTSCRAPGSMAGMELAPAAAPAAAPGPAPGAEPGAGCSPRGAPLRRMRRSRLLATNCVSRPSRSTVPSSSRALASVARRPSGGGCGLPAATPAAAAAPVLPAARLSASRLRPSRSAPSRAGAGPGPPGAPALPGAGGSMASTACPAGSAPPPPGRAIAACLRRLRLAPRPSGAWPPAGGAPRDWPAVLARGEAGPAPPPRSAGP